MMAYRALGAAVALRTLKDASFLSQGKSQEIKGYHSRNSHQISRSEKQEPSRPAHVDGTGDTCYSVVLLLQTTVHHPHS